jgi:carbamoyl-phosphate synthase/aspartate carbamoyltransferase/dihydroorotase
MEPYHQPVKLPGLIDPHVHLREPGATHKEDRDSGTAAALAGGFTMVLAMPNTQPPIVDRPSLALAQAAARKKARCDYGLYLGAGPNNTAWDSALVRQAAGLKMYLDQTYGPLRLDDMTLWAAHLAGWPRRLRTRPTAAGIRPIAVHAEGRTLAAAILLGALYNQPLHLCHVSRREEILLIRAAKEHGLKITCEVTPHHLFLTNQDAPAIGPGRSEVRPVLAEPADREALWENLPVIDAFATDHAPHTLAEKDGPNPPPGFPGLETALSLFLTAVNQGRLSLDDLVLRMATNPRRIFGLPEQANTWIEVDLAARGQIRASQMFTRCAWTPFEGLPVTGRLKKVVLRGSLAFSDSQVLAAPGSGLDVRQSSYRRKNK